MGGVLDDIEKQIDLEKARQQQKKAQEAQEQAEAAAKAAKAAKDKQSGSIFF